jgi:hypothetical protein
MWKNEGVHLALYQLDDLRGAVKKDRDGQYERINIEMVRHLISESQS